jgi:hypothetical protein
MLPLEKSLNWQEFWLKNIQFTFWRREKETETLEKWESKFQIHIVYQEN